MAIDAPSLPSPGGSCCERSLRSTRSIRGESSAGATFAERGECKRDGLVGWWYEVQRRRVERWKIGGAWAAAGAYNARVAAYVGLGADAADPAAAAADACAAHRTSSSCALSCGGALVFAAAAACAANPSSIPRAVSYTHLTLPTKA